MQTKLNKLIAIIVTFTLVGFNFISTSVYAAEDIQSLATTEANVEFDAKLGDSYNTTADIANGTNLNLTLNVLNTGYLKDVEVSTDGSNYLLSDVTDKNVKSVNDNKVEINTINAGESANIVIPVKVNKAEKINPEDFSKDTTVTLKATYVNAKGQEKSITKTVKEHLTWTTNAEYTVNQNLIRYIKYADGKTMIGLEIVDGVKDNAIPYLTKEISLVAPKLANKVATSANVTGDNISYTYKDGIVTIKQENKKDSDNKIAWNSTSSYIVTYLYDNQVDSQEITSSILGKSTTADSKELTAKVENKYTLKDAIGNIIEGNITGENEISKGYMYSNLNKQDGKNETTYSLSYVANIALADLTDSIKIVESTVDFTTNADEKIDITNSVTSKKVSVLESDLTKILGNDGTIKVESQDGTELGTLSKDKTELEVNSGKLIFETSKTVAEGNLTIQVSKAINADINYGKDLIKSLAKLDSNAEIVGIKEEKTVSDKKLVKSFNLTEPTSSATIDISSKNLSTVVENKDVVITATLDTNSVNDALYQNPKMTITLPDEVKSINLTDAQLLYEDELVPANFVTDGNKIQLDLTGTQTKYSSQSTSSGTVVRLVSNITLDNLVPSKLEAASLTYTNEATGETKIATDNVNVVAQTGFVTTSGLTVDGATINAQETENIAKVKTAQDSKEMNLSGTVVNNLGSDADGFTILGKIPYSGNTTAEGTDLGSNINTTMASEVIASGADFTIYYSENVNEDVNSTAWTTKYTANAKSFKLVSKSKLANGTKVTFNYKVTLPANLTYSMTGKATYAIYYNNNSTEGTKQNIVVTKAIGVTTGETPAVSATVSAINTNTGDNITDGASVQEGDYITYKVTVKNTGKEDATNVKVTANLPTGIGIVKYTDSESTGAGTYSIDDKTKTVDKTIGTIKAGSEQTAEFTLAVTQVIADISSGKTVSQIVEAEKLKVDFVASADKLENQNYNFTVNNTKGFVHADLSSDVLSSTNIVSKGQTIVYKVNVKNVNEVEKTGVTIKLQLPKGIEYTGTKYASTYDKTSNIVTATIDKIEKYSRYSLSFDTKVTADNDTLASYAIVTCGQTVNESRTNTLTYTVGTSESSSQITATQTANVNGTILDTDSLEFYIDIKNNQLTEANLNLKDSLPSGLSVEQYRLTVDGKEVQSTNGGYISTVFSLPAGKSAKATIIAKIAPIEKGTTATFENAPALQTMTGTTVNVNSIKVTIKGTGNTDTDSNNNTNNNNTTDNNNNNNDDTSTDGTYKINGTAWLDSNYDGKKDDSEEKISGLTVTLYSKATGNIATDADNKEVASVTTSDGKYTFKNLKSGDYYVVIGYDTSKYDITTYQAKDLSSAENSDFVSAKQNDTEIATTNTITITNANIYNVDLGLTDKKKFDLSLNQVISKMTVTNTKAKTHVYSYNKSIAKVELSNRYVEYATVLVEYTIKVTNDGKVAGYAKSIVDYLPSGMTFNSELNGNWYVGEDGNAYNTSLANTIINPGETKEITLVLSKKMTADNMGTFRNTAEIKSSYNEYGLEDIDSVAGNKKDGEDDISSTDAIILVGTGKEVASITGITLGVLAIITLAVYEIKKHVINKMYRNIL